MTDNPQIGAIMVTFFKGYSALLQQDASSAVEMMEKHRKIITQTSDKFDGKILHYYGERTLSIFNNVSEAVECAMGLQLAFRLGPVLPVSIGIHQGSIIYENEEVTGDDVYLTSWIASEAVSGSVLVSDGVYDKIRNQPEVNTKFLKTCQIRHIKKSSDVYAISNTGLVVPDRFQITGEFRYSDHRSTGALINFWKELKRRKVVRVVTVYAAVSYVTLELTSIIEEPLGLPDWTMKFLIILLCVVFVLIAIFSWVYDFTPDGIKVTQPLRSDSQLQWSGDPSFLVDRPIDAILILQKSLRISPGSDQNYRIYKNLAEAHFSLQEYDKTHTYLEQSKSLKPDFPETEKCLARLCEATGNIDQSIQHWQNFIEMETDTAEVNAAQNHLLTIQR